MPTCLEHDLSALTHGVSSGDLQAVAGVVIDAGAAGVSAGVRRLVEVHECMWSSPLIQLSCQCHRLVRLYPDFESVVAA